ncbi:uncharacterized protein LOC128718308 [Anopheles marshallii]|uniref:uncharacterized protein LOC128718308 n=1 Tax=Anopheles marshallii TaxID=1521116 RepID=UPI00237AF626|nr:uncharacterized protein LOC128718308 [Anopheles marshallii]
MEFYWLVVSSLLLLVVTETEVSGAYFDAASTYCAIPLDVVDGKNVVPADLQATCNRKRQEGEENIKQAVEAIRAHIMKQAAATDPIWDEVKKFTANIPNLLKTSKLKDSQQEMDELRTRVLVAAIEAGRTSEALTQYLILGAWDQWQTIVDRIYQNKRRHPKHIENLLSFIRTLPAREERLEFYHYLKKHMVEKKDYGSYLGAMFAQDASHVVFDADGKTPLNENDVAALYTTMIDGAAEHFRTALLTGAERLDLFELERYYPNLFDFMFEPIFNVTAQEMRKFNSWRMMEALCTMERPMVKARMFQKTINLLVKHFQWVKENEFYAPMLAGYFEACVPHILKVPATKNIVTDVQNTFSKFGKNMNYQKFTKVIGKNVYAYAG